MSSLVASAFLGVALLAGAPSEAPATKNFEIDFSGTTQTVKTGEKGTLAVHLKPAEGYYINEKGPLQVAFTAPDTVSLEKAKLVRADAQGEVTSPEFSCGFDAKKAGAEAITVNATFVVCDSAGTTCEMKRETVRVAVAVED